MSTNARPAAGDQAPSWRTRLVSELAGDILEVGVGSGTNLPLYRRAATLTAIEPKPESVERARAAAAHLSIPTRIEVASVESIPFPDQSFDHVVSSLVFCSVNDPAKALREIRRVLRPHGTLHMMEHIRPAREPLGRLAAAVTPAWSRIAGGCHLDRRTLDTLSDHGWEVTVHERKLVFVRLTARPVP